MAHQLSIGDRVWCPECKDYVRLLKVRTAAKLLEVKPRTIYRYIEEGRVFAIKAAGKTYRVCDSCLLKPTAI
jgi:excisionase family DNA binding protein